MAVVSAGWAKVCRSRSSVPFTILISILVSGALAGTEGIKKLLSVPKMAMATTNNPVALGLKPAMAVPRIWPNKIARKVPDSIRLLPISNSWRLR